MPRFASRAVSRPGKKKTDIHFVERLKTRSTDGQTDGQTRVLSSRCGVFLRCVSYPHTNVCIYLCIFRRNSLECVGYIEKKSVIRTHLATRRKRSRSISGELAESRRISIARDCPRSRLTRVIRASASPSRRNGL